MAVHAFVHFLLCPPSILRDCSQAMLRGGRNINIINHHHHHHHHQHQHVGRSVRTTLAGATYRPTIWSYNFGESMNNMAVVDKDRVKKLDGEVKRMMNRENSFALLELIDDIQRLGLGYRFKDDITNALYRLTSFEKINTTVKTLHHAAILFRILRQHDCEVSLDVFKSFIDCEGNFIACDSEDVKGMLSLYEASYLASEGEELLDGALTFTKRYLSNLDDSIETSLNEQVNHALELPLHQTLPRLEALWYIEHSNLREERNQLLLELATLDFNMVQAMYQTELKDMSRWWKSMGLSTNKLDFVRDRLMECFFWAIGIVFEPQFSSCRKWLTKVAALVTIIDDVYDVYAALEELELFTDAVQRWDVAAVETLPDYMQVCFLALCNTINEMAYDILNERGVNPIPYLTKVWADLCKTFLQEAKWNHNKCTPTFEEYIDNASFSSSGTLFLVHAYFFVSPSINNEALNCIEKYHSLLRTPSTIFRLCNDLATSSIEIERGETANSILCYMNDTGLSEEISRQHISELIRKTWRTMNQDQMSNSTFEKLFKNTAMNLARIASCTYQHGDAHRAPDTRSKKRMKSLIVEPILFEKVSSN